MNTSSPVNDTRPAIQVGAVAYAQRRVVDAKDHLRQLEAALASAKEAARLDGSRSSLDAHARAQFDVGLGREALAAAEAHLAHLLAEPQWVAEREASIASFEAARGSRAIAEALKVERDAVAEAAITMARAVLAAKALRNKTLNVYRAAEHASRDLEMPPPVIGMAENYQAYTGSLSQAIRQALTEAKLPIDALGELVR